jgi:hypothetical protein
MFYVFNKCALPLFHHKSWPHGLFPSFPRPHPSPTATHQQVQTKKVAGFNLSGSTPLRSGFPTSAAMRGASVLQAISRHASLDALLGYVRAANEFRESAGTGLL